MDILSVFTPLLVIVAIGFVLEKRGLGVDAASVGRVIMLAGTPALVFSSLTSASLPDGTLANMMLSAVVVTAIAGIAAIGLLTVAKLPVAPLLPSLTMPNTGNFGIPLVLLMFPDGGLPLAVAFFFAVALIHYVAIPIVLVKGLKWQDVAKEPVIYAVLAAFAFRLSGTTPPVILSSTTEILGGMMIPLMLILLGGAVARLKVVHMKLSIGLAVARLGIGLMAGGFAIYILGLEGPEAGATLAMAAMPTALVTYVFALRFDRMPQEVSGVIVASTTMGFLLLPGLIWLTLLIAETL